MARSKWILTLSAAASLAALSTASASAAPKRDARVDRIIARMTLDEKIQMVSGVFGTALPPLVEQAPPGALGGDGFIPGVPRLGIPDMNLIGAGLGVTNLGQRANGQSTALPSSLALAASFDRALAYSFGAVIGDETRREGFNVSLGGGVDLTRDPRGGRAFEYHGEDPVLAGRIVGETLKGTEAQGVVATIKHYALNDIDNGRFGIDVQMGERAMREAELLAFEIGVINSRVGAVMCSYNLVNGVYACENPYLLNTVLKKEWGFAGWVMSDWGATHSTAAANAGLDQEFFRQVHFRGALKQAIADGSVPASRLDDMVYRMLSQLNRVGALDRREPVREIDAARGLAVAQRTTEEGAVLLKNDGVLPLDPARSMKIAVIGLHADKGVMSGGGSAQVYPVGGNAVPPAVEPKTLHETISQPMWVPSSPLAAIRAKAGAASVTWDDGTDAKSAARAAAAADVVLLFAGTRRSEGADLPDLSLGDGQDALIEAMAKANANTIVVLETGGAHLMPWIDRVKGVLNVWYPGQGAGPAIANLLFGTVNPSGKLPLSFPRALVDLPRPKLPGPPMDLKAGFDPDYPVRSSVSYEEGAQLGYKWYDAQDKPVLFPFGYGLSYTQFGYSRLSANLGAMPRASFTIANTGKRAGTEIAQVYVAVPGAGVPRRLAGWSRTELAAGKARRVIADLEPKALANWDVARQRWVMPAGAYQISVGASSRDLRQTVMINLPRERVLD
jgi:beta-glucosidase